MFRRITTGWFPRLRNYTVVERIGEGGFGVVYKAIHHTKQRIEALKVLFSKTAVRTAYFENEVHLIAKLQHPNIATLYEARLATPPLFYTMEFVEGEHLDAYLKSREVSLARRIEILRAVALAIGYAHAQGVVHRDIKPQNILIDASDQPRIIDFGIARKLGLSEANEQDAETPTPAPEGLVGTFGYIAPEQVAGQPADARADIYALGALLYHCVTGEPARFANQSVHLTRLLRERRVSYPGDLAAIIARCVHPEPEQRYQDCAAFVEDLDNYLAARPIRAREDQSAAYRAVRFGALVLRRSPYAVRGAIVALVAGLLTGMFWFVGTPWFIPAVGPEEIVLVTFTPETLEAVRAGRVGRDLPGLNAQYGKSWRLLHGQLMERLAVAAPRVVVWDYYFPDQQPAFDAVFVRGVRALQASGAAVVIGADQIDVNGEPLIGAAIREAIDAWGILHSAAPNSLSDAFMVPVCVVRGQARPVPSLATVGFAAARFPKCLVDVRLLPTDVQLCYRKRHAETGEPLWRPETDELPIASVGRGRGQRLLPTDKILYARIKAAPAIQGNNRVLAYEDVLTATDQQLRDWFGGYVVMVGQMIPPHDEYTLENGDKVFGCQVQAQTLEALVSGARLHRFTRSGLAIRIACWCALAGVLVGGVRTDTGRSLRTVALICAAVGALGVFIGLMAASHVVTVWVIETAIAATALSVAGSAAWLPKAIRERLLRLAPAAVWPIEGTTLSSTVLADT